jgi:carbonic anhydrase
LADTVNKEDDMWALDVRSHWEYRKEKRGPRQWKEIREGQAYGRGRRRGKYKIRQITANIGAHTKRFLYKTSPYKTSIHTTSP